MGGGRFAIISVLVGLKVVSAHWHTTTSKPQATACVAKPTTHLPRSKGKRNASPKAIGANTPQTNQAGPVNRAASSKSSEPTNIACAIKKTPNTSHAATPSNKGARHSLVGRVAENEGKTFGAERTGVDCVG
jgi:hypothetical protein